MTETSNWPEKLEALYQRGLARYGQGQRKVTGFFLPEESVFLARIGCTEQEMFDFVEDGHDDGEPSFEAVLLIQAERHSYLYVEQAGKLSDKVQPVDSFPSKTEQLAGIAWLPRIIAKARAKLRGELPPQLMYG